MAIDLESLYRRYGPLVLRRCRRLLRDEERAVDAMQDVFVELLRRERALSQEAPSSLCLKVATNVCLNKLRTLKRHPEDPEEALLSCIAAAGDTEERALASSILARIFGRERESTQAIAVMHLVDGMSLEEVAAQVNLSVSGVRKRLRTLKARFEYPELRQLIEQVPSDVRLGIVDSCHAGALIRAKGGKKVPAFLIDDSTVVRGQAFLTASSAEEAAQESDKLGGSYFTTALLTGLRGAADASRDGKVTLTEAYQFAFNETLAKSESSLAGPQHPAYDIHLAGTGDLVLTDVRATSAGLSVASELAGRLFLRDSRGHLVAELNKAPGYPVELGLEPGTYAVTVEISGGGLLRGEIELAEGRHVQLAPAQLSPAAREPTALRGDAPGATAPALRLNVSLVPPLSFARTDETIHFGLNLPVGLVGSLRGLEIGALANLERREAVGLQIAGGANWVGGDVLGIQIGGATNISGGELLGLQISGVASIAAKGGAGLQVGGAFNQAGLFRGGQIAGAVNVASALKGLQLAGVVNVAGEATGVQISGVVNCARSASLQLGVVNIAEDSAASFGLINVVKNGYHAAFLGTTDLAPVGAAIKSGGRWGYTLIAGGTRSVQGVQRTTLTGGFGLHLDGGRFFVDVEVAASEVFVGSDFLNSQRAILPATARVVAGLRIWKDLAVVVGPTLNVVTSWDGQDLDLAMPFVPRWTLADSGGVRVEMFPGFVAGLQI